MNASHFRYISIKESHTQTWKSKLVLKLIDIRSKLSGYTALFWKVIPTANKNYFLSHLHHPHRCFSLKKKEIFFLPKAIHQKQDKQILRLLTHILIASYRSFIFECIWQGDWMWPTGRKLTTEVLKLKQTLNFKPNRRSEYTIWWQADTTGRFSVKTAMKALRQPGRVVDWHKYWCGAKNQCQDLRLSYGWCVRED